MRMLRLAALSIICSVFCFAGYTSAVAESRGQETLDFGDRVTVTVFGQPEMSGSFQIDGRGFIELPMVGAVPIAHKSVKDAQEAIKARLTEGFLLHPVVSITVAERRPIYVVGDVKAPGTFPFRHGSTVLTAIAQAGGYGASTQPLTSAAVVEYLAADERVQSLERNRVMLLVRQARIEAQFEGHEEMDLPILLGTSIPNDKIDAIIEKERQLLNRQREARRKQLELLEGQKPRLAAAKEAVENQIASQNRQLELLQVQLDDWADMNRKGLALRNTRVSLLREQAALNTAISGFRTELARLSMNLGEIDMKIQDAKTGDHRGLSVELQDLRSRLDDIESSLPSARQVREVRRQQADGSNTLGAAHSSYRIKVRRSVDETVKILPADEQTVLLPGDIVEVTRNLPGQDLSNLNYRAPSVQAKLEAERKNDRPQ